MRDFGHECWIHIHWNGYECSGLYPIQADDLLLNLSNVNTLQYLISCANTVRKDIQHVISNKNLFIFLDFFSTNRTIRIRTCFDSFTTRFTSNGMSTWHEGK